MTALLQAMPPRMPLFTAPYPRSETSRATALNFRDVMVAMSYLDDNTLRIDCSGTVWLGQGCSKTWFGETGVSGWLEKGSYYLSKGLLRDNKNSWPCMQTVLQEAFEAKIRIEYEHVFLGKMYMLLLSWTEGDKTAGYEHRPMLLSFPTSHCNMEGKQLKPGHGGQETLENWINWELGRHYDIEGKVLIARFKSQML
ncbi:unnamed protein product [Clonostachys rosea f. rosea IK726]|uniref:Uncharacterized protein n=1 Tax=Clonostachys rosea f. rosea IK726 TaxID=1349383 RepID=A0ACA9UC24_BIOOC|nr:unnamed protein product [Clonostachys rosea f. rosea IK726]